MDLPRLFSRLSRFAVFGAWHVLALVGVVLFVPGWAEIALAASVYAVGMFGVTAGYHRYFAHRSYRTSRVGQFVLAWLAESTLQKGVLWWAAHHRVHHRFSDEPGDPHSPWVDGTPHAHVLWVLNGERVERREGGVPDLVKFPELRWLDRYYLLPPLALAVTMSLFGGWNALVWGFAVPILAVQHATFCINSVAHLWGTRPYATKDRSRNNVVLALLTFGEGWHNNHHGYPGSARQGFLWWQVDVTWLALRGLQSVGLVWGLREPPERVLLARRSRALRDAKRALGRAMDAQSRATRRSKRADTRVEAAQEVFRLATLEEAARVERASSRTASASA